MLAFLAKNLSFGMQNLRQKTYQLVEMRPNELWVAILSKRLIIWQSKSRVKDLSVSSGNAIKWLISWHSRQMTYKIEIPRNSSRRLIAWHSRQKTCQMPLEPDGNSIKRLMHYHSRLGTYHMEIPRNLSKRLLCWYFRQKTYQLAVEI